MMLPKASLLLPAGSSGLGASAGRTAPPPMGIWLPALLTDDKKCDEELVRGTLDRESSEGCSSGSCSFSSTARTFLILACPFPADVLGERPTLSVVLSVSRACLVALFEVARECIASGGPIERPSLFRLRRSIGYELLGVRLTSFRMIITSFGTIGGDNLTGFDIGVFRSGIWRKPNL
jgi:hypothetical protein